MRMKMRIEASLKFAANLSLPLEIINACCDTNIVNLGISQLTQSPIVLALLALINNVSYFD